MSGDPARWYHSRMKFRMLFALLVSVSLFGCQSVGPGPRLTSQDFQTIGLAFEARAHETVKLVYGQPVDPRSIRLACGPYLDKGIWPHPQAHGVPLDIDEAVSLAGKMNPPTRDALPLLAKTAQEGNPLSQAVLGAYLVDGVVTRRDRDSGLALIKASAESGCAVGEMLWQRYTDR